METEEQEKTAVIDSPVRTQDFLGPRDSKKKSNIFVPLVIVVVLVVLAGGAFFFIRGGNDELAPSPTPLFSPTQEPVPTPAPINREEIKIKVLNGTGVTGEAALLRDKLKAVGYTDVDAGNAAKEDYQATEITIGSSVTDDIKNELIALLEDTYTSVKQTSRSPSGADVEIITGLRKGQTPKPSPSPSPKSTPKASPTSSPKASPTSSPTASPTATPQI